MLLRELEVRIERRRGPAAFDRPRVRIVPDDRGVDQLRKVCVVKPGRDRLETLARRLAGAVCELGDEFVDRDPADLLGEVIQRIPALLVE